MNPPFDAYFEDHPFQYFEDLFPDFDEPSFSVSFALQQFKIQNFSAIPFKNHHPSVLPSKNPATVYLDTSFYTLGLLFYSGFSISENPYLQRPFSILRNPVPPPPKN
jgi:hypothetical protein